jgi:hypothetical protein
MRFASRIGELGILNRGSSCGGRYGVAGVDEVFGTCLTCLLRGLWSGD